MQKPRSKPHHATSTPPQSVLIANRLRPQCDPEATPMLPQCDPKATAKPGMRAPDSSRQQNEPKPVFALQNESSETHRTLARHSPGMTFRLPGAPPASVGPRNVIKACGGRAEVLLCLNGAGPARISDLGCVSPRAMIQ